MKELLFYALMPVIVWLCSDMPDVIEIILGLSMALLMFTVATASSASELAKLREYMELVRKHKEVPRG